MRKFLLACLAAITVLTLAGSYPSNAAAQSSPAQNLVHPRVIDIFPGAGSATPGPLVAIGSTLFFAASDKTAGRELWKSVPPYNIESTSRVADINPGMADSWPEKLTVVGETLLFRADDGAHGRELWRCEPPYTHAYLVGDIDPGLDGSNPDLLTPLGTTLFFQGRDASGGVELWKSAPPFTSAEQVGDIWAGQESSTPRDLKAIGWTLLFSADDSSGRELWKSEPPYEASSTMRVMDINPDGASDPKEITILGNKVFFSADDGTTRDLWVSEMPFNAASTYRQNEIQHLRPTGAIGDDGRPVSVAYSSNPYNLLVVGEDLFFTAYLWKSGYEPRMTEPPYDSTHTYRVEDIMAGFPSSFPDQKASIGDQLFFVAYDAIHGSELWRAVPPFTKGELVLDINKGSAGSNISNITAVGRTLFFSANNGTSGNELWKSEPPYIAETTEIVSSIAPGKDSSWPEYLAVVDGTLLFTARDDEHGSELRVLDRAAWSLPETGFAPNRVTRLAKQPAGLNYNTAEGMVFSIPGQRISIPLVGVSRSGSGWDLTWLSGQAGYLEGSAFPTLPGNTVIAGHAYLADGTPGPFNGLELLKWGDRLEIYAWGQRFIYEVREISKVAPDDKSVMRHEKEDWITLLTCQGFNETTGRYTRRVIVRAVLVDVQ